MKEKYLQSNRIYSVDFMRAICAFFVVCIHGLGMNRELFIPITRIAVPFFFIVSGYFIVGNKENSGKEVKQRNKLFKYFILFSLLYIVWDLIRYGTIFDLPGTTRSSSVLEYIVKFVVFNCAFYGEHLWFIIANVYVLVIYQIMKKINMIDNNKLNIIIISLLFVINLIFGSYSGLFFNKGISGLLTRNFLLTGLPFFLIGVYFKKNEENIKANTFIMILGIIFSILSILEYHFIKEYLYSYSTEICITTIIGCILIFSYCISNKQKFRNYIAYIGSEYSLTIYVIHPIVLHFVKRISILNDDLFMMLIVYILSLFIGIIVKAAKRKYAEVKNGQ